jgi:ubiquinone/menaquinone biosynthesis C-methylase UbiE
MAALTGHAPAAHDTNPVTPDSIMEVARGFMAAKHLFAACSIGIFEALADGPATLAQIAARAGISERAARISADAMVALGFLDVEHGRYSNGAEAGTFLAGRTPADLRPVLRFWDQVSYPAWTQLEPALRGRWAPQQLSPELQEVFSAGVEALTAGPAQALAAAYDFTAHRRLLDVGGGTGSITAAIARRHPQIQATVLERAEVVPLAQRRIQAAGLQSRISAVAGDAVQGPYPAGHDVVLIANLIHYFTPEQNRRLLELARAAVSDGGRLLLVDFWTDPAHTSPVPAALMAGEFAVLQEHGDVYSAEEVRDWLRRTRWHFLDQQPLGGPVSVLVAEATPAR